MAFPRNSIMHLNHTANPTSNSNFLDLNLPPQHNTGLGGIPIAGIPASSGNSLDSLQDDNPPHWLKSLQALTEMDGPLPLRHKPTTAPLQHTDPSAQSQLESLPSSFKPFQLSLPTARLSDSLQTPQQNPHRFITEFNTGPPLGKEENSLENAGFVPPCFLPLSPPTAPFSSLTF
uniref:CCR4-NOT transcription complex subunit 4 n=1 Tax=Moschus moschiferus TaxID=68415 RepID=A0A8C6DU67_MOSMO